VTSIGERAFYGCSGLTSIQCEATTPPSLGLFAIPSSVSSIYVPSESVNAYKLKWKDYATKIQPIS
jgi:hypothetical protein